MKLVPINPPNRMAPSRDSLWKALAFGSGAVATPSHRTSSVIAVPDEGARDYQTVAADLVG